MPLLNPYLNNHHNSNMPLRGFFSRNNQHGESDNISQPQRQNSIFKSRRTSSSTSESPAPAAQAAGTNPFLQDNSFPAWGVSPPTRRPAAYPARNSGAEAPPPYSLPVAETKDDPYAFLATFDTVFLVDDSGSMSGARWEETRAALAAITPTCVAHDHDGIDVHFLNDPRNFCHLKDAASVQRAFDMVEPMGHTPTGTKLRTLLRPYLLQVKEQARRAEVAARDGTALPAEIKPQNIIVITDGAASDDVEVVIKDVARKLDQADAPAWQVGIQFFQVGRDPEATKALRELDDSLEGPDCPRDIVDTVPWSQGPGSSSLDADKILKCVLGAVVKKLDRIRNSHDNLPLNKRR